MAPQKRNHNHNRRLRHQPKQVRNGSKSIRRQLNKIIRRLLMMLTSYYKIIKNRPIQIRQKKLGLHRSTTHTKLSNRSHTLDSSRPLPNHHLRTPIRNNHRPATTQLTPNSRLLRPVSRRRIQQSKRRVILNTLRANNTMSSQMRPNDQRMLKTLIMRPRPTRHSTHLNQSHGKINTSRSQSTLATMLIRSRPLIINAQTMIIKARCLSRHRIHRRHSRRSHRSNQRPSGQSSRQHAAYMTTSPTASSPINSNNLHTQYRVADEVRVVTRFTADSSPPCSEGNIIEPIDKVGHIAPPVVAGA